MTAFKTTGQRKRESIEAGKEAYSKELARRNRYRKVFGTPEGLLVLDEILEQCNVLDSIFETSAKIYQASGRQEVGLELYFAIMQADAGIIHKLIDIWKADHDKADRQYREQLGIGEGPKK